MGFHPREIDAMSLWEFVACTEGWKEAHGSKKERLPENDMSDDRLRELGVVGF